MQGPFSGVRVYCGICAVEQQYLHDDVGTVAVVGDHFLQAADLAFNAAEAFLVAEFQLRVDGDCFVAGADHASAIGGGAR